MIDFYKCAQKLSELEEKNKRLKEENKALRLLIEWAESGDASIEDYRQDVIKFKQKWFKSSRNERLIGYIDKKIKDTRKELIRLVGGAENETD